MFKVRMLMGTKMIVIEDDKAVLRKCYPHEDVYVSELNPVDIKNKVYRPYAEQIVAPSGELAAQVIKRQRPGRESNSNEDKESIAMLQEMRQMHGDVINAAKQITQAVSKLTQVSKPDVPDEIEVVGAPDLQSSEAKIILPGKNGDIPDEAFIMPGEDDGLYTPDDYVNNQNRVRQMISRNKGILDGIADEDHGIQRMHTVTPRPPKFTRTGMDNIEGEIELAKQTAENVQDIVDMTPVELENMRVKEDEHGKVDVFGSLGAKVFFPEEL